MKFKFIALFASLVLATPLAVAQQEKKAPKSPHEDFIRASRLEAKQVEQVLDTYEKAAKAQQCTAGWHNFNDIQTLTGLEGQFLWTENLLAPAIISFKFDPNGVGSFGTYTLARAGTTAEQGDFRSVPNNPAIGFAAITLMPQGGDLRAYVVEGMMTDDKCRISNMSLEKIGPQGPLPPPFWVVREALSVGTTQP